MSARETPETERQSTLSQVAAIIGDDAAVLLSVRFGGRRIYIPKNPSDTTLAQVIGFKAASLLARQLGGTIVEMPIGRGKRERILILTDNGRTVAEIAEVVGVTERHVKAVRAEYRDGTVQRAADHDAAQTDLFAPRSSSHPR